MNETPTTETIGNSTKNNGQTKQFCSFFPWLAIGLLAVAFLCVLLTSFLEESLPALFFSASIVVLLLFVLLCYSSIYSATHADARFKGTFRRVFYRNWVYYVFFIVLMIVVIHVWNTICNEIFCDGAHCFFRDNRRKDIISSVTAVWEELVFRLLLFMITSFAVTLVRKPKWLKYLLGVVGVIGIICVQLQFGALHYNPLVDESHVRPMIIQGGAGVIMALTYAGIMCYSLRNRLNQSDLELKGKIKALLVANLLACLGSSIVHAAANLLMVFTQTF